MESDCRQLYAYVAAADADGDNDGQGHFLQQQQQQQQGGGGERKRRFTEEQVRSLERTFHSRRARLEPREKAALARELGLRPRQVAIWFQNKRARWRSKQLEHDFADLRGRHDALRTRVEALKQEKLALAAQLEELKEKLNQRQEGQSGSSDGAVAVAVAVAEVDDKALVESAPAADVVLEGPAAGWYHAYDDHLAAYGGGLPDPLCATPELWETTAWPLVEWNAVA